MKPTEIQIVIDEVVVTGPAAIDREELARALQHALPDLLSAAPLAIRGGPLAHERLDAGTVPVGQPGAVATAVARQIAGALRGAGS